MDYMMNSKEPVDRKTYDDLELVFMMCLISLRKIKRSKNLTAAKDIAEVTIENVKYYVKNPIKG